MRLVIALAILCGLLQQIEAASANDDISDDEGKENQTRVLSFIGSEYPCKCPSPKKSFDSNIWYHIIEIPEGLSPKDRKDLKKKYKQLKSRVEDMLEEVRNQNHAMFKHTDRTRIISEKLVDMVDRVEEAEEDTAALFEKIQLINLKAEKKNKKTKDKIKEIEARLGTCQGLLPMR